MRFMKSYFYILATLASTLIFCKRSEGQLPPLDNNPVVFNTTEEISSELSMPWGLTFLPDGSALISERNTARIYRIEAKSGKRTLVGSVSGVSVSSEGGLLGLETSLSFDKDRLIYAYISAVPTNKVIAIKVAENFGSLQIEKVLLDGIKTADRHHGGRLRIGPDGKLWIGTGDAFESALALDINNLNGKILRINVDGTIPLDNPFPNSPVYSYGHRNVQGLTFAPDGTLFATELGHRTGDELNRIQRGANYGWPATEGNNGNTGVRPALVIHPNDCSPSGIVYHNGSLWMAAMRGQRLYQIPINADNSLGIPISHLTGVYGRIRTVEIAPDSSLWILTTNTDRVSPAFGGINPKPGDDKIIRLNLKKKN